MEPFFGSNWFAFTQDTARYIVDFVNTNPGYVRYKRFTENADETFLHTILMNSPRQTNVYDYEKYVEWLKVRKGTDLFYAGHTSLRYMDWSERGKPKPATLDMSYFDELKNSDYLFARKVDEVVSAQLLDEIDSNLL